MHGVHTQEADPLPLSGAETLADTSFLTQISYKGAFEELMIGQLGQK
ncbi:MAG: hypothetical protein CM15mP130_1430 [Verrucomicrobiota bacterium]|nr:MAG: hypothetical protein CM15mP130_1430 [Verrucomicrobiota bacterium]